MSSLNSGDASLLNVGPEVEEVDDDDDNLLPFLSSVLFLFDDVYCIKMYTINTTKSKPIAMKASVVVSIFFQ
uniref:Wsv283 n=1 Tax=White spot syndrome virus TaxID=92652 RepID=A0A2U9G9S3_WSSV|nr:wsv283 [Shrimp white spot syndrome virus]AWQ60859.1 wsv283 [Shrimp white spot syndrome virus]AWQ61277.1 wsv283 [Shrimp white spot syndrome virus]AWQ61716.1 wsv283 [Shrimp white spot syndrome virus]AWQ62159.1 wsv283 [Shrimp white spot syndrome virus]